MRASGRLTGLLVAVGVVAAAAALYRLRRGRLSGASAAIEEAIGQGVTAGAASSPAVEPAWIRVDGFAAAASDVETHSPEAAAALPTA